jgi:hypothetical protein
VLHRRVCAIASLQDDLLYAHVELEQERFLVILIRCDGSCSAVASAWLPNADEKEGGVKKEPSGAICGDKRVGVGRRECKTLIKRLYEYHMAESSEFWSHSQVYMVSRCTTDWPVGLYQERVSTLAYAWQTLSAGW